MHKARAGSNKLTQSSTLHSPNSKLKKGAQRVNDKNKKPENRKAWIPGVIVLAAISVFNALDGNDPEILIPIVMGLLILAAAFITISSIKKAARNGRSGPVPTAPKVALNRPFPTPEKRGAARRPASVPHHADEAEEAIHCSHVRGKQKYIQQLDSYLKNGIIDRAEYKILRERYEKLDIPDDYH